MDIIKSSKRGQCLLASFAMCLDSSLDDLISEIGHDGMEVKWPELEEPECFRGFHIQELIDCAIGRNYAVTQIDAIWVSIVNGEQVELNSDSCVSRFLEHIKNCDRGIILGEAVNEIPHAAAWDGENIYDPMGKIYPLDKSVENNFTNFESLLSLDLLPNIYQFRQLTDLANLYKSQGRLAARESIIESIASQIELYLSK